MSIDQSKLDQLQPTTLQDFQRIRTTLVELISNPWCDIGLRSRLTEKLTKTDQQINRLKNQ